MILTAQIPGCLRAGTGGRMNSRTVERRRLAWAALAVVVVVSGAAAQSAYGAGNCVLNRSGNQLVCKR